MLKKILASRYFPTLTKPLLAGLVGSGVVFGLRAVGVTDVVPSEVNAAVAPLVGFVIAMVTSKPQGQGKDDVIAPTLAPSDTFELSPQMHAFGKAYATAYVQGQQGAQPTLGKQVATLLLDDLTQVIDSNPQAIRTVASTALELLLSQPKVSPTAATQPGQPRSNFGAVGQPPLAPDYAPTTDAKGVVIPTEQGYPAGVNPPTDAPADPVVPTPPTHF